MCNSVVGTTPPPLPSELLRSLPPPLNIETGWMVHVEGASKIYITWIICWTEISSRLYTCCTRVCCRDWKVKDDIAKRGRGGWSERWALLMVSRLTFSAVSL